MTRKKKEKKKNSILLKLTFVDKEMDSIAT